MMQRLTSIPKRRKGLLLWLRLLLVLSLTVVTWASQLVRLPLPCAGSRAWAQMLQLEGVPNFYQVSQDLYRSGQPTAVGMRALRKMAIKTVVNLRTFHSDLDEIGDTGLGYKQIAMQAWNSEKRDILRFLKIATDDTRTPVLVHCKHGSDRTGVICAAYRIVVCGWSKQEAIDEMINGGFGFHRVWVNLIKFIEDLDVESLREELRPSPNKAAKANNEKDWRYNQALPLARVKTGTHGLPLI